MRPHAIPAWTLALACSAGVGCARQSVGLEGRACHDGRCATGYVCHPLVHTCVPPLAVSCDGQGICPSQTTTGTPCGTVGSFVPCADDAVACEQGCRTCRADGLWGPCEGADAHCGTHEPCAEDERCVNDVCLEACEVDGDCPTGSHCPARVCVPEEPVCGDGVQEGDEACDGIDLGGHDCRSEGLGPGTIHCLPECELDTSGCAPATCGNLTIEPPETCDGGTLGSHTCASEGFGHGSLTCTPGCTLDTSACVARSCGDGIADPPEPCDNDDLAGHTCEGLGLGPGTLSCDGGCELVLSGCTGCGNGVKDGGEVCDTGDLGGLACPGGLACTAACELDFSNCSLPSAGNGADGVLTVSTTVNLGQTSSPAFGVTAIGASQVTLATAPSGLAAGDEVLLINIQGDLADCGSAGHHEFLQVSTTTSTNDVTFPSAITGTYGAAGGNGNLTGQKVVLVRVPHFTSVTVRSGGVLTTNAWNGTSGGLMVMRVSQALVLESGGALGADGLGYRPGVGLTVKYTTGKQGESICGNPQTSATTANYGGGGGGKWSDASDDCGQGGGGGGFGQAGGWQSFQTRCVNAGHTSPAQNGGVTYGADDQALWLLGSGGGSGGTDDYGSTSGTGGAGGGLILIFAARVTLDGTLSAKGGNGDRGTGILDTGNGGGGSGGAIVLSAAVLGGTGVLSADGGKGLISQGDWNNPGGDGGVGRVRIDYQTAGGAAFGSGGAQAFLAGLASPDPGFTALYLR